jgi:hypothetical protein
MNYPDASFSASDEARVFIERIEAIEELGACEHSVDRAIERAVDMCCRPFFEAVRLAMIEVGNVSASKYRKINEAAEYYCLALPAAFDEREAMIADVRERGRRLLAAIKNSLQRQLGQEQSAQEVLSALILLVEACERVHFEQRYGQ